jgi:hypothetical protein
LPLLVVFLLFSCRYAKPLAQNNKGYKVPQKVLDNFNKLFPKAEHVEWSQGINVLIGSRRNYVIFYTDSGRIYRQLSFNNSGKIKEEDYEKEYDSLKIPEPVIKTFHRITKGVLYPLNGWRHGNNEYYSEVEYNYVKNLLPLYLQKYNTKFSKPWLEIMGTFYDRIPDVKVNDSGTGYNIVRRKFNILNDKKADSITVWNLDIRSDGKLEGSSTYPTDSLCGFWLEFDSTTITHMDMHIRGAERIGDIDSSGNFKDIPVTIAIYDSVYIPEKIKEYLKRNYHKCSFSAEVSIEKGKIISVKITVQKDKKLAYCVFDNRGNLLSQTPLYKHASYGRNRHHKGSGIG